MNFKTLSLLGLMLATLSSPAFASSELVCDCTKNWSGGPIEFFRGYEVNAGTVVGRSYSDVLYACRMSSPSSYDYYSATLKNCTRQNQ